MTNARVARGRKTQGLIADFMRAVWPKGKGREAFQAGTDIENTPGWRVEVKATSAGSILDALRQAEGHPGRGTPVVIWRPNGYGEERIGKWVVAMRLEDFRQIANFLNETDFADTA